MYTQFIKRKHKVEFYMLFESLSNRIKMRQREKEKNYKILLFLFFVFCATTSESKRCNNATICIYNQRMNECQNINATRNLSDLNSESEHTIHACLTSEVHSLDQNLIFTEKKVELHGLSRDRTIISCNHETNLQFENTFFVKMSDLTFQNCSTLVSGRKDLEKVLATLFFKNTPYVLRNVRVINEKGLGLYAYQCINQTIDNCKFHKNTKGHLKIIFLYHQKEVNTIVTINGTEFYYGSSTTGGIELITGSNVHSKLKITNSRFKYHRGNHIFHKVKKSYKSSLISIDIMQCEFSQAMGNNSFAIYLHSEAKSNDLFYVNLIIEDSNFTDNHYGAIALRQINHITVDNCIISRNRGIGIHIDKKADIDNHINISRTDFHENSLALFLNITVANFISKQVTIIRACNFSGNNVCVSNLTYTAAVVYIKGNQYYESIDAFKRGYSNNIISIENSDFLLNHNDGNNCSSLYIHNIDNVTLIDTSFTNNSCTGLVLQGSRMKIQNHLNMTRNAGILGGALRMVRQVVPIKGKIDIPSEKYSKMILKEDSEMHVFNNTASRYGGGIYSDETCMKRESNKSCPFRFDSKPSRPAIYFKGNNAILGGDQMFGGCLSNCKIDHFKTWVNISKDDDEFWKFVQSDENMSQSRFTEYPNRVVFCKDSITNHNNIRKVSCNDIQSVKVYRGQTFNVSMMLSDEICSTSAGIIQAEIEPEFRLGDGQCIKQAQKYCANYSYSISTSQTSRNVTLKFIQYGARSLSVNPAILTIELSECPLGFRFDKAQQTCICYDSIEKAGIECKPSDRSLKVPPFTWIGVMKEKMKEGKERVASHNNCGYCKSEGTKVIHDLHNDSDELCTYKRRGILCGACVDGYSLKLGNYICGDCSNFRAKGFLLILLFIVLGFVLVLLLLLLNLTVSTGIINGLIFYSNIIYSNNGFFPTNLDRNTTHLDNAIMFLYTVRAWLNLDFGFTVCLFDGLDTYKATWLQFIFPIYIWILIVMLIISSKHSTKISKLIGHNAVSVLATLFLLSYTKLLTTVITAFSYTTLNLDNGVQSHPLWIADANIEYLSGKHVQLFIISMIMTLVYIIPFTLLITFGPILQAKSHYKLLKWINKIKPFLDAFYGPFTDKYRYWPGLLLITRLVLFTIFALYSLGETAYQLASNLITVTLLLIILIGTGLFHKISPHLYRKDKITYLEIFFLLNLVILSVFSLYFKFTYSLEIQKQQIITLVMVGSAFVVSCAILLYHIIIAVLKVKRIRNVIKSCFKKTAKESHCTKQYTLNESEKKEKDAKYVATSITHSSFELREPLLSNEAV